MSLIGNAATAASKSPLAGKQILVVDDNAINLDIAAETLMGAGARVDNAASGQEALDHIQRAAYDLILLDLGMPHIDGWQVGRAARASTLNARVNILVFTASDSAEAKKAVADLGARGLVGKPVDVDDLLARVTNCVK